MEHSEIILMLDDAKNLLDTVYYHYERTGGKPWVKNKLTLIDSLLIELIKEAE